MPLRQCEAFCTSVFTVKSIVAHSVCSPQIKIGGTPMLDNILSEAMCSKTSTDAAIMHQQLYAKASETTQASSSFGPCSLHMPTSC